MLASILIATFNRDNLLELNLKSLAKQQLNKSEFEIIIINDGLDTEKTKEIANKFSNFLNIKYIFSGKRNTKDKSIWRNPGFAYNYGAQFSSGEYIFICGAEIYHENNTISLMLSDIRKNRDAMVIPSGRDDRDGIYTNALLKNLNPNNYSKLFSLNTKLPFLMCIPRNKFFEINGYDEDMIGIGYDDDDLVTRLRKIGLNYLESEAKIIHLFHKRTPDNYVNVKNENTKIFHDKMVLLNNQIFETKRNESPIRNIGRAWGQNNIWYLKNIPKKIHFYWGDDDKYLSYLRYLSIQSAVCNNPDFEVYLHVPEYPSKNKISWKTLEQSVNSKSDYNWFEEVKKLNVKIEKHDFEKCGFSNDKHEVHKADYIRWIILFELGGFWSDIDIFYSKSLYDANFNIPENHGVDTGIHIYPDFKSHAIGFLFSSINNSMFKACHRICSEKYKKIKEDKYQSFGSDILNNNFKTIENIKNTHPNLSVINIGKNLVYKISPTEAEISALYLPGNITESGEEIGIHWFGGHRLSRKFERELESFNLKNFNSRISNFINKYLKNNEIISPKSASKIYRKDKIISFIISDDTEDLNIAFLNCLNQNSDNYELILISKFNLNFNLNIFQINAMQHIKIIKDINYYDKIKIAIENSKSKYIKILKDNECMSEQYVDKISQILTENDYDIILTQDDEEKLLQNMIIKKDFFEANMDTLINNNVENFFLKAGTILNFEEKISKKNEN